MKAVKNSKTKAMMFFALLSLLGDSFISTLALHHSMKQHIHIKPEIKARPCPKNHNIKKPITLHVHRIKPFDKEGLQGRLFGGGGTNRTRSKHGRQSESRARASAVKSHHHAAQHSAGPGVTRADGGWDGMERDGLQACLPPTFLYPCVSSNGGVTLVSPLCILFFVEPACLHRAGRLEFRLLG